MSETSRLVSGATSVCYTSKGGARPFSEHDGSYEDLSRISVTYEVEEWYPKPVSQFQDLEVFRSKFFGKVLVIDDEIMITERGARARGPMARRQRSRVTNVTDVRT